MTEWRALTQGGCLAGSANYEGSSRTFTVPAGVTVVKMYMYYSSLGDLTAYVRVTPGASYTLSYEKQYDSDGNAVYYWYLGSAVINAQGDHYQLTVSWSNAINATTPGYTA